MSQAQKYKKEKGCPEKKEENIFAVFHSCLLFFPIKHVDGSR
tara:strand:- start:641 stop:766 length:126 start_codon:yes stop_codon:yes gene_type:complete